MKLEEIQELWNRDRDIDITDLGVESVRIPQIHDKYLKIYIDERIRLKGLQFDLNKLVKLKTDYYAGNLTEEELEKLGWEQFLTRLIKTEITKYLEADEDIIKMKKNIVLMEEKIDWIKYKDGIT